MAVTLISTNGIFTRLGKLFKIARDVESHQTDASAGLAAQIEDVIDEYNSADMKYADALFDSTENWQLSAANIYTAISILARDTVIGMVDDDNTLNQKTIKNAIEELIDQMGTSNDIKGNQFTATGSGDGGTVFTSGSGNGYVITSVTNGEGKLFQNLHQDSIKVKCIRDAQVTGTAGRETHALIGQKRISDIRHPDWPGGNGQSSVMSVSDPSYNQQRGLGRNGLNNSDFEDFSTTDTPDKWTIVVGAAGTTIKEEGTTVHRGSKSLELVGDAGGTLMHISQSFNTSGQTTTKLYPETRYCVSFWTYRAADVAAGVLRVSVKDGDAAILDSGSAALSVTFTADTGGAWVHHSFSFSTPLDLPDAAAFHIELTTAITNTKLVHIDGVQMFRMAHLTNTSSFHIAIIPGSTDFIVDDEVTISISEATHSFMQTYMNKFLGLEGLGLQMPYQTDGSETAADSLIA